VVRTLVGGLIWTVCLNGATLALNSAFDRDEGDIGYLDNPPPPPAYLAAFSLVLLGCGLLASYFFQSRPFVWLMGFCVMLSLAYSVPPVRLKALGGADLVINMLGYGAATIAAGALATDLLSLLDPVWQTRVVLVAAGFGFLFGAFYPMTQIYQIPEDSARGDRTLAIMLGPRGSLRFALALEFMALACHLAGLVWGAPNLTRLLLASALVLVSGIAWILFTAEWLRQIPSYPAKRGMYRALWLWALSDVATVLTYGFVLA
jgi:1,4-dihydroxy-2-naphthoate octaprenyltransferase